MICLLLALFLPVVLVGCGLGKAGTKREDFFTSGSREADQRASQRMAKEEQLTGSGEGGGEKGAKKAKTADPNSGGPQAAKVESKQSLFERLGGEPGLVAIVDDFIARALQDPRVNWPRKGVRRGTLLHRAEPRNSSPENVVQLKKHFVQFLSLATGGPSQYDGQEIKASHAGMHISNPEFDATIGDLKASLDKLQIPNKEQKELLAIVESTRPQIVTER